MTRMSCALPTSRTIRHASSPRTTRFASPATIPTKNSPASRRTRNSVRRSMTFTAGCPTPDCTGKPCAASNAIPPKSGPRTCSRTRFSARTRRKEIASPAMVPTAHSTPGSTATCPARSNTASALPTASFFPTPTWSAPPAIPCSTAWCWPPLRPCCSVCWRTVSAALSPARNMR